MRLVKLGVLTVMKENIDYELIPIEDAEHWNVRIKTGEFIETVFQFGALKVNDETDSMTFNFDIVYTPDDTLTTENIGLQNHVGVILSSILESAIGQQQG
jgi:hypothetical protein